MALFIEFEDPCNLKTDKFPIIFKYIERLHASSNRFLGIDMLYIIFLIKI